MSLGLRIELIGDWILAQRFYIRIPISLMMLAAVTLPIYYISTRPLGYSYGETFFWVIVFGLALDRVRLIVESYKK